METAMNVKQVIRCATAASFALVMSTAYAAGDAQTEPMTGKQKATAIGATTGAVAGAVVGGPVGAVVGGVAGGVIGHQGTDSQGRVSSTDASSTTSSSASMSSDGSVRSAQAALEAQGYNPGSIDGQMGPNTRSALMKFQQDKGLAATGSLDGATRDALGLK
jgi:hypothetical protein